MCIFIILKKCLVIKKYNTDNGFHISAYSMKYTGLSNIKNGSSLHTSHISQICATVYM